MPPARRCRPASIRSAPARFGLFPTACCLQTGATYTARLAAGIATPPATAPREDQTWSFTVAPDAEHATGNTAIPTDFSIPSQPVVLTRTTEATQSPHLRKESIMATSDIASR